VLRLFPGVSQWAAVLRSWISDVALRRMLNNSAWLSGATAVTTALNAVQGVLIGRVLGLNAFGILGLVVTFVTLFNRLTSFRLDEFVVRSLTRPDSPSNQRSAAAVKLSLCVEAAAALLAFGLLWMAAPLGARLAIHTPDAYVLIRAYGAVVLVNAIAETTQGILQVYGRYRTCSIASSVGSVVSLVGAGTALWFDWGLAGVVGARIVGEIVNAGVLASAAFVEVRRQLGTDWWSAQLGTLAPERAQIAKFILSTNGSLTLSMLTKDGDVLWLGLFRGPAEAGLFRLAQLIAGLIMVPAGLMAPSIFPDAAGQAARLRWQEFRSLLHRASILVASYVVPAIAILALIHEPVIRALWGADFTPAGPALIILAVGMGLAAIVFWGRLGLLALDRPDYLMKVHLVVVPAKLIGVVTLVPTFGYIGAAALLAMVYAGAGAACAWKVRAVARGGASPQARALGGLAAYAGD
jgi:O-antigen/teichoic acid export membrane protein